MAEKSLNRLLLFLILKTSNRRWSLKKGTLKNLSNFSGNHLRWSLFIIKLPKSLQRSLKETPMHMFSREI